MRLEVTLPPDDIAFLSAYAIEHELGSKSAAARCAVQALRLSELPDSYAGAWADWAANGDANLWDGQLGNGSDLKFRRTDK